VASYQKSNFLALTRAPVCPHG